MSVHQLTYMLLPDFSHQPNETIHLGSILSLSEETGLPDPDDVLNRYARQARIRVKSEVDEPKDKPWSYAGHDKKSLEAGIWASTPIISTLSLMLGFKTAKGHSTALECERIETQSFTPDKNYISAAIQPDEVSVLLKKYFRPSVFMVTGIKIVPSGKTLKINFTQTKEGEKRGGVGGSGEAAGVPLSAGVNLAKGRAGDDSFYTEKPGPLILAYQLKRIRLKILDDKAFSAKGYYRHGILRNHENQPIDTMSPENLEEFWDFTDITPDVDLEETK